MPEEQLARNWKQRPVMGHSKKIGVPMKSSSLKQVDQGSVEISKEKDNADRRQDLGSRRKPNGLWQYGKGYGAKGRAPPIRRGKLPRSFSKLTEHGKFGKIEESRGNPMAWVNGKNSNQ
ncbi:hypothetical protein B9Z55_029146 [Caenorhabditis nigoni]|uniref:Uncharacterized protein n=1 Tax=Caenorhabditis nigoni TaxID=1611254 RepID=A0A2G5S8X9_9PELO|nr:hypothetical protein B9Z55_029146 [Caenorhabditis nigoni]